MSACNAVTLGCVPCPYDVPEIAGFKTLSWETSSNHSEETLQDAKGNTISICYTDPGEDISAELICVGGADVPCVGDIIAVSGSNYGSYFVTSVSTSAAGVKGLAVNLELRHKCSVGTSATTSAVSSAC